MNEQVYDYINREIEDFFTDDYLEKDVLRIDVTDFLPLNVDHIGYNKLVFESQITDIYLEKNQLFINFSPRYLDELRNETQHEWEEQLINQRYEYFNNLL